MAFVPPVRRSHKRVGSEPARSFPRFKPSVLIHDKVAMTHQFIPFQTPKAFRSASPRRCSWFGWTPRSFDSAVHHAFVVSLSGMNARFHKKHGTLQAGSVLWGVTLPGILELLLGFSFFRFHGSSIHWLLHWSAEVFMPFCQSECESTGRKRR